MSRNPILVVFATLTALMVAANLYLARFADWTTGASWIAPQQQQQQQQQQQLTSSVADRKMPATRRHRPTHHACDGYDGIYHVAMSDILGGVGTALFQLVMGQLDYAATHHLKPWIHFNDQSQVIYDPVTHGQGQVTLYARGGWNASYVYRPGGHARDAVPGPPNRSGPLLPQQKFPFPGTGIWNHYFEPVSDFVPGDVSCENKLYVTMDLYLITPGLHGFADTATRCWRYEYLSEYITKPHIPYHSWLEPQRIRGHHIVHTYIQPLPYLKQTAERANPQCSGQSACLGLHIRHSGKAAGRRQIAVHEFLPFALAFVQNGGQYIYVATDSTVVWNDIHRTWPASMVPRIRMLGGNDIVRSNDSRAVFDLRSHHTTNQEAIVEILALSQCQFLVHGLSAVSEASIWMNLDLHNRSVNLEDAGHMTVTAFGELTRMVLNGIAPEQWPHAERIDSWWDVGASDLSPRNATPQDACSGATGILLIHSVGSGSGAASAFFTVVLNQLLYADLHRLTPWIHLDNSSEFVYDSQFHGRGGLLSQRVHATTLSETMDHDGGAAESSRNGSPLLLEGTGVWDSYFDPVRVDSTCQGKPIFAWSLTSARVSDLPWAAWAWHYDSVPDSLWNPKQLPLRTWYEPMRHKAHAVVEKYFRFRPHLTRQADRANPDGSCLAIHIRVGDKRGQHRKKVKADLYLPYVEAYIRAGGKAIYLATDSHRAVQYMEKNWPQAVMDRIRSQGPRVVRTLKGYPTHFLDDHHRVNSETLVDILALSKCQLLVHSYSTVSEAAIYLNMKLHEHSANLEDPHRLSAGDFEALARRVIRESTR